MISDYFKKKNTNGTYLTKQYSKYNIRFVTLDLNEGFI